MTRTNPIAAATRLPKTKAPLRFGSRAAWKDTQAVTTRAATVVAYMKTAGHMAHLYAFPDWASQIVISTRARPAKSWLDPPKRIQIRDQNPVQMITRVRMTPTVVPKWTFLKAGIASPTSSALATRMKRRTSCITVSAMMIRKDAPKAAPKSLGTPRTFRYSAMPPAKTAPAPLASWALYPAKPPKAVTAKVTERTPRTHSVYMAPAPTGRASVSFSNWRAVPEVETRLCHPEQAPQAMVTKRIGHRGVSNPGAMIPLAMNPVKAGKSPKPGIRMKIPMMDPTIPIRTSQNE